MPMPPRRPIVRVASLDPLAGQALIIIVNTPVHRHYKLTYLFENGEAGFWLEVGLFENLPQILPGAMEADIGAINED